jgi:hypothetical protein
MAVDLISKGVPIVLRNITSLKLFTSVAVLGLASITVACTQTPRADPPAPLMSDSFDANPASPNCYPDLNHCASYSSGDLSTDKPTQPK